MIYRPKQYQTVLIRYRPSLRDETCLHMAKGNVMTVASGRKTVNCLVDVCGHKVVIPRGNLFKI